MHTLLAQLPGLLWTTDRDLTITEFSGRDVKRFSLEIIEVQGTNVEQLLPYIEVQGIYGGVRDILEAHRLALQGRTIVCEASFRGIDIWFLLRIAPYLDANGAIVGCLGTASDIYEHRHIEHLLENRGADRLLAQQTIDYTRTESEYSVQERALALRELNAKLIKEIEIREQAEDTARREQAISEALRQVAMTLSSTLDLDVVLQHILDTVETVVPHNTAEIMLLENGSFHVEKYRGHYLDPAYIAWMSNANFVLEDYATFQLMASTDEALLISDVNESKLWRALPDNTWIRSYVGARIAHDGEVFGFLNLNSKIPNFFNERHAELLKVFAAQASLAIRNAKYHEQSQELAILEERQHLARDLHDAVSQTLLSANMFAESLPHIVEHEPARLNESLSYLRLTIRGALAELRALLVELRPAALLQANLKTLIEQLTEAVASRKEIDIQLQQVSEYKLPNTVKIVVYRIVQEALNNIVKHAYAQHIMINIQPIDGDGIEVCIRDDGRGFDMNHITSDHMGLSIMRERATEIGAQLFVDSQIGVGTTVILQWSTA